MLRSRLCSYGEIRPSLRDVGCLEPVERFKEVVIDLLLAQVHATLHVEAGNRGEAKVTIGDVNEVHSIRFLVVEYCHIKGGGGRKRDFSPDKKIPKVIIYKI